MNATQTAAIPTAQPVPPSSAPVPPKAKTRPPTHAVIELDFEYDMHGVKTDKLTMQRPKVQSRLDADLVTGSNELQGEIVMIANMCSVSPQEIHALYWSDYRKCQDKLGELMGFRTPASLGST